MTHDNTNSEDPKRREVLGDVAADLIDEMARRKAATVNPEVRDDFFEFIEEADEDQMMLLNLSQMFMELAIANNEKRLVYASAGCLAVSGALDGHIEAGNWSGAMDYADKVWNEAMSTVNEIIEEQISKVIRS